MKTEVVSYLESLSDDRQSFYGDYQLAVNSEFAKGNGTFSF